jgi:hypothetical protein
MGILKIIYRRYWKSVVVSEFTHVHGVQINAVRDKIGRNEFEDILNTEYEYAPRNPQRGVINLGRTLEENFGIIVASLGRPTNFGSEQVTSVPRQKVPSISPL